MIAWLAAAWAGPAPSARAEDVGAVEVSGGFAALRDAEAERARAELGGELAASYAPLRGTLAHARWTTGATSEWCPTCGRLGDLQLSVRQHVIQSRHLDLGPWASGVASWASGALTAQGVLGASVRAGSGRVWVDLSAPVLHTVDIQEALRVWPELGVDAEWSDAHRTRVAVVGLTPSVRVVHRWSSDRGFVEGELGWFGTAPRPAERVGVRAGRRW